MNPSTLIEPPSTGPVNVFMVTVLPCGAGGALFDGGVTAGAAADDEAEAEVEVEAAAASASAVAVEVEVDVAEVVELVADRLERRD